MNRSPASPVLPSPSSRSAGCQSPESHRAVITGVGCVSPLGADRESTWRRLLAGDRAGRRLGLKDLHGLARSAEEAAEFIGAPAVWPNDAEHSPRGLISAAVDEAFDQAGFRRGRNSLAPGRGDPAACRLPPADWKSGCVIGSSKGDICGLGRLAGGRGSEEIWTRYWPHDLSAGIARRWQLGGPCLAPIAACATGLVCLLRAAWLIESGACDLVVAGAADASLEPAILAAFRRMGVLSRRVVEPAAACRSFQADRDGFFVGEGAAAFVLERADLAAARGAQPLARWRGGALLSDPSGLARVDPTGAPMIEAITQTLLGAEAGPDEIGHINLHGTGTLTNDLAEAAALRTVFGSGLEPIPCLALKPSLGHLLGAAGAVELAITILALSRGEVPPTAISGPLDPECELPLSASRQPAGRCGLKLSLGFGGHVAAACLGAP